jgi:hypothetical protein
MGFKDEKKKALGSINQTVNDMNFKVNGCLHDLSIAKDYDEFMKAKAELIQAIVEGVPLEPSDCIYCVKMGFSGYEQKDGCCDQCEYGKTHGICIDEESNPPYVIIDNAIETILDTLPDYK